MAHPGGRPSIYTPELADFICEKIATSTSGLRRLCAENPELPDQTTINEWRFKNHQFSLQYTKAKQVQSELLAEECLDISDDDSRDVKYTKDGDEVFNTEFAARSRIRIDTRKWLASKLAPKIYGDKQVIETVTTENDELKKELAELRAKLAEQSKCEY